MNKKERKTQPGNMLSKTKRDKGSSSIFLLMILASVISITVVFIWGATLVTDKSFCNDVLFLSGRSVLSEYDKDLLDEYNIFAFQGNEKDISAKMQFYSDYSFKERNNMDIDDMEVINGDTSLRNTTVFKGEILSAIKYDIARKLTEEKYYNRGIGVDVDVTGARVLRNASVKNNLPSNNLTEKNSIWKRVSDNMKNIDQVFEKGADNALVNLYILDYFKNGQNQEIDRDTFFKYEIEYILQGNMDDSKNRQAFRSEVILVRNAINLLFIMSDPTKQAELTAAAEVISPGIGGVAVKIALAESWALLESENDMQILEHGKRVPLYKTEETWATDIQSIIENKSTDYIEVECEIGLTYTDYLEIFLFFMDETVKLTRAMDLIQINMQGNYNKDFLIREYNCGFRLDTDINGKNYSIEHKY